MNVSVNYAVTKSKLIVQQILKQSLEPFAPQDCGLLLRNTQLLQNNKNIERSTANELTWCALAIRLKSCFFRNWRTTSPPNVNETPRSFSPQPVIS